MLFQKAKKHAQTSQDRAKDRTHWRSSLKNGTPRSKTTGFGRGWRRLTMLHTSNRKKSAMATKKVTRDLTDGNVQTPSGRITSPLEVAQHLRALSVAKLWTTMSSYSFLFLDTPGHYCM